MRYSVMSGFIFVILILLSQTATASIIGELSAADQARVEAGQQVTLTEKISGKPWPRMRVYQLVPGTAEESAAVTMDWELKPTYTKNLKLAKISKIDSPTSAEVDYIVGEPMIGDEKFTMLNQISLDAQGVYHIDFHLVRADHMKDSHGTTRLENHNGKTLMALDTFTDPNRALASKVAGFATRQTAEACDGFVAQVVRERDTDKALLNNQISALRQALAGSK